MLEHRFKSELSGGDVGWLNARHHLRVTAEGNPAHRPLGALVVWNDDVIAPVVEAIDDTELIMIEVF